MQMKHSLPHCIPFVFFFGICDCVFQPLYIFCVRRETPIHGLVFNCWKNCCNLTIYENRFLIFLYLSYQTKRKKRRFLIFFVAYFSFALFFMHVSKLQSTCWSVMMLKCLLTYVCAKQEPRWSTYCHVI